MPGGTLERLGRSTMLFYTGLAHDSSAILRDQQLGMMDPKRSNLDALHVIKRTAEATRDALLGGDVDRIGPLMDEAWSAKKKLSADITNAAIDRAYCAACEAGAIGGKIAGAGGGGFLLLICPPDRQSPVEVALHSQGLVRTDFNFDFSGARVLMNNVAD